MRTTVVERDDEGRRDEWRGGDEQCREAGEAWGHGAADWSSLFEHYSIDVLLALLPRLGIGPDVRVLDVACGAGLAVRLARSTGATVAGIDASHDLLAVARARTPEADLREGSMYALPWADGSFDVVISINGIWGGCQPALDEAFRVLRPDGAVGLSFWGPGPPHDLRGCFKVIARHSPAPHLASMRRLNDIGAPGVAEAMLAASGFVDSEAGVRTSVVEWPDAEIAWRAISSMGPAVPALRHGDVEEVRREVLAAIEPARDEHGAYRFRNDHRFVTARRP